MSRWMLVTILLAGLMATAAARAQQLSVEASQDGRILRYDGQPLLELGSPGVTAGGFERVYRFPGAVPATGAATEKADTEGHGRWKETITSGADNLTIRYEFSLPADSANTRVQWAWRLDPAAWRGTMAVGVEAPPNQPERPIGLRAIEELRLTNLKQLTLARPDADIMLSFRASDGAWGFRDVRMQDQGRAYRLEYSRPAVVDGRRAGWFEVTIRTKKAESPFVVLTTGPALKAQGIQFQTGALRDPIGASLGTLVFLHTLNETLPSGQAAGEITVIYRDGEKRTVLLRSGEAFTSTTDDPRNSTNGWLTRLPDNTPAWVSQWQNPRAGTTIERIEARSLAGGWRLLAATGTKASAEHHRVEAALRGEGVSLAQATVVSLDGTWQFSADGIEPREIPVPAFWDKQPGLKDVHLGVYRREFDLPAAFSGQRIAVHFDAVGDAAEVFVNGRMAGRQVSPALPFEVDITPMVTIPSVGNKLEVRVQDDTFFSIPVSGPEWRAAKHWVPRGMGTNNRKGLYQSVSLRARPAVHISDVRVQTSVRKGELVAICMVRNTNKAPVNARLIASVHPAAGGSAVLTLPPVDVHLPGYVTTQVMVRGRFQGVELWQPNHPTLYSLRCLLTEGDGKRLERVDTRFGFREVWFDGPNFYLNGIRCNLRGESPAYAEKPELMSTREAAAEMIRRYQQVNFNVLRFHAMPAPPHVLDLCDEMGMLVIDESSIYASWSMLMPEHDDFMANCRDHLARWVQRDRNHPSVVMWSADNEGLNVGLFTPEQLAEWRKVVDGEDGTRPVTFDGDGSGMGASPASVKHYVRTIADLEDLGGVASGYARDLRNDIYWATEYKQEIPLGCGEFLYPEGRQRTRERELAYMMGLQTRGYRLANWFDIRPYNPSMIGFLNKEGTRPGLEEAYEIIRKSFAPVGVFDKAYDALGPYPAKPQLPAGQEATRELIIYNDEFEGEQVEVEWVVRQGDREAAGARLVRNIPLGGHIVIPIQFTPVAAGAGGDAGELELELISRKNGKEMFRDTRIFEVK